jgi:hypothetical protein
MSESHLHYEEFSYSSFGKKINENQSKRLHNKETLLENSSRILLSKFDFASLLLDISEEIISYERKYRDGDTLNENEKLLSSLQDSSKLIKQFFHTGETPTDTKYLKKQEEYKLLIKKVFSEQRALGNVFINEDFEEEFFYYLEKQKDFVKKNSYSNTNKSHFSSNEFFCLKGHYKD